MNKTQGKTRQWDRLFKTGMREFIGLWSLDSIDANIKQHLERRQCALTDPLDSGRAGEDVARYYLDNANFNLYDYPIPDLVRKLSRRIKLEKTLYGYGNIGGSMEAKETISQLANLRAGRPRGAHVTAWNVFAGCGATSLLEKTFLSLSLLRGERKEIIFHQPVYPVIPFLILRSGQKPVAIDTRYQNKFLPTLDEIKRAMTSKTVALCLVYPNNPSGTTFTDRARLQEIFSFARKNGLFLICDEVYQDTTHSGHSHISSLNLADSLENIVSIASLSKDRAGFCDLRIGYAVGDPRLITAFHLLASGQEWQMSSMHENLLLFDTCLRIMRLGGEGSSFLSKIGFKMTRQEKDKYFFQIDNFQAKIERHVRALYGILRGAEGVEKIVKPEAGNVLFFKLRSSWYRKRAKSIDEFLRTESVYIRAAKFFLMTPDRNWFRMTVTQPFDYMLNGLFAALGITGAKAKRSLVHHLRAEMKHEPQSGRLLTSYACGLSNMGKYKETLAVLKKVRPGADILTRFRLLYLEGVSLLGLGRFSEAVKRMKKALRVPVHKSSFWTEGRSVNATYYQIQLSLFSKEQLAYNLGVAYSFLKRPVLSKRYLEKAKRGGYENDVFHRLRVIHSIPTQVKPNRWYQNIFIAESYLNGKLIRGMHFGTPIASPESAYFIKNQDYIVKNALLPFFLALAFLNKFQNRFLIIGLGGGTLPKFLQKHVPGCLIDIVEIDRAVLIGANHMGFRENDRTRVHIESYTEFLKRPVVSPYDLIMLDLDSKLKINTWELRRMQSCLSREGLLVVNCYAKGDSSTIDNEGNIERILRFFSSVWVLHTTSHNYGYVCFSKHNPADAALSVEDILSRLWERVPLYRHKDDLTLRIKNAYLEARVRPGSG